MSGPRRIQVDAPRRMVTAERTRLQRRAAAEAKKKAVGLMDNAGALPTTPQPRNHCRQAFNRPERVGDSCKEGLDEKLLIQVFVLLVIAAPFIAIVVGVLRAVLRRWVRWRHAPLAQKNPTRARVR